MWESKFGTRTTYDLMKIRAMDWVRRDLQKWSEASVLHGESFAGFCRHGFWNEQVCDLHVAPKSSLLSSRLSRSECGHNLHRKRRSHMLVLPPWSCPALSSSPPSNLLHRRQGVQLSPYLSKKRSENLWISPRPDPGNAASVSLLDVDSRDVALLGRLPVAPNLLGSTKTSTRCCCHHWWGEFFFINLWEFLFVFGIFWLL